MKKMKKTKEQKDKKKGENGPHRRKGNQEKMAQIPGRIEDQCCGFCTRIFILALALIW